MLLSLPPNMKTGENCTSGMTLKLANPERQGDATSSIHRQEDVDDKIKVLKRAMMDDDGHPQAR